MTIVVAWALAAAAGYLLGHVHGAEATMRRLTFARAVARREAEVRVMHGGEMIPTFPGLDPVVPRVQRLVDEAQRKGQTHVPVPAEDLRALCELARDYAQVRELLEPKP